MGSFIEADRDLPPGRVAELLRTGRIELVDVREPPEREEGYIEGSRHIELERLAADADSLPRDRPVVFACRVGARSAMAARAFRAAGFDAYNLDGGIERWVASGLPIAPPGGRVADH